MSAVAARRSGVLYSNSMEIGIIAALVTAGLYGLFKSPRKKRNRTTGPESGGAGRSTSRTKSESVAERSEKKQIADDIVTIILPTIGGDGK